MYVCTPEAQSVNNKTEFLYKIMKITALLNQNKQFKIGSSEKGYYGGGFALQKLPTE